MKFNMRNLAVASTVPSTLCYRCSRYGHYRKPVKLVQSSCSELYVDQISRFGMLYRYQYSVPNLLILMTVDPGPDGVTAPHPHTQFYQVLYKFMYYQQ
jgi:hypothetical protein